MVPPGACSQSSSRLVSSLTAAAWGDLTEITVYRLAGTFVLQGFVLCISVTWRLMEHTAFREFIKTNYVETPRVALQRYCVVSPPDHSRGMCDIFRGAARDIYREAPQLAGASAVAAAGEPLATGPRAYLGHREGIQRARCGRPGARGKRRIERMGSARARRGPSGGGAAGRQDGFSAASR